MEFFFKKRTGGYVKYGGEEGGGLSAGIKVDWLMRSRRSGEAAAEWRRNSTVKALYEFQIPKRALRMEQMENNPLPPPTTPK